MKTCQIVLSSYFLSLLLISSISCVNTESVDEVNMHICANTTYLESLLDYSEEDSETQFDKQTLIEYINIYIECLCVVQQIFVFLQDELPAAKTQLKALKTYSIHRDSTNQLKLPNSSVKRSGYFTNKLR